MLLQVLFLFFLIGMSIGDVNKIETKPKQLDVALNVISNDKTSTIVKQASSETISKQFSEGGGITVNVNDNLHHVTTNSTHMGGENDHLPLPDINYVAPEKNDNKISVPKKGVIIPDSETPTNKISTSTTTTTTSTTTTTTTTTTKPTKKKPTITEPGDEIPYAPSNFNPKLNINNTHNNNIPNVDKKNRQADYIVPIVAVILSVPLVAIIISVLYKRGAEWWQHRHYRRMDFLIEGMYNN